MESTLRMLLLWLATLGLAAQSTIPVALAPMEWVGKDSPRPESVQAFEPASSDLVWTVMEGGRLLVTGGGAASHWFNPATRTFTEGPRLCHPRSGHRALRLADGRLLLVGGTDKPAPAEVSAAGLTRFEPLSSEAQFNLGAEALQLPGGKVLLADGASGKTWIWDGRDRVATGSPLKRARVLFRLSLMPEGQVLVSGGIPADPQAGPLPLELRSRGGRFSLLKAAVLPRARHQASLLPNGQVLLWGGQGTDAQTVAPGLERVDPLKDRLEPGGALHPQWGLLPATCPGEDGNLWIAADGSDAVVNVPVQDLPTVLVQEPRPSLRTLNRFMEPSLAALPAGILVGGTAASGPSLERWDPRTQSCQPFGALRPGTENLVLMPDRRVLAVGPEVVDIWDVRTGKLKPLGWRRDLEPLLKRAKRPLALPRAFQKWPKGMVWSDHLLIPLSRSEALVVGGGPSGGGSHQIGRWRAQGKRVQPAGVLQTPRAFQGGPGEGGLKLPDGTVLIWGGV